MLSTYIRWPFIRQVRLWNAGVCGQVKIFNKGKYKAFNIKPFIRSICNKNNRKIMQSFEDCVFQPVAGSGFSKGNLNSSSLREYSDKNNVVTTNQQITEEKINSANDFADQQQILEEYEKAVQALNSLQSNAETLRACMQNRKRTNCLEDTKKYLLRSGLSLKDLESLSFIHVAGTKGKGSTCALTESILRTYGVTTGFFSSPHLVSLTERIRLNGQPISKKKFSQYFWPIYNTLHSQQEYENDMPAYFKFLTILCFHVFKQEKVDVAILEVGIGGELDCTNIIPNTKTVGISSLGLEHTQLLGHTLQEIAWQKAGIIKPNSMVYTSVKQTECLEVIKQRAQEKNATLYMVPDMELYLKNAMLSDMQIKNKLNQMTILNGSLALQLAYDWLRQNRNGFYKEYQINQPFLTEMALNGLLYCNWPGRCQIVKFFNLNMHLDGAHTIESIHVCGDWFKNVTHTVKNPKILIFNTTGNRDSCQLLTILCQYAQFDLICFVPNISHSSSNRSDTLSILHTQVEQLKRAQMHADFWRDICREKNETNTGRTFPTVLSAFQHIRQVYKDRSQELDVLVTGSIHLIGAAILSLNELCKELKEEGC